MDRTGAGIFKRKTFTFEPAGFSGEKEAEAFAVMLDGWTLRLHKWSKDASYSVEIWKGNTFKASAEWFTHEDGAVTAYAEGDLSAFAEFAEAVIQK
jgi:hypothetical protein